MSARGFVRQSKMAKRRVNFTISLVKKSKCVTEEIELSKICEEKKSVTVHGVVTSLSSMKESKTKVKYFRGTIADQSKKVSVVSFEPKLWKRLNQSHENCSSVALVNCNIQEARNKTSGDYEIVASSQTEVTESERQFEIDASEDEDQVTVDKLCQLAPNSITSIVGSWSTVTVKVWLSLLPSGAATVNVTSTVPVPTGYRCSLRPHRKEDATSTISPAPSSDNDTLTVKFSGRLDWK